MTKTRILERTFEYSEREQAAVIKYTFTVEISDGLVLAQLIRHLSSSVKIHLHTNKIFEFKLGYNFSSKNLENFNASLAKNHDPELIAARLLDRTQSSRGLVGVDSILMVVVTALIIHPKQRRKALKRIWRR